jgi:uncharacterized protein with FMN-binding domain
MRRVLLALSGTVAGLVMLLSFKSHPASTAAAGVATGAAGSSAAGSAGSGAGSVTGSGQVASGAGGASGTGGAAGSGTASGQVVSTAFGPMQVQATLTGGRITRVTVLQETNVGARSQQIDAGAIPQLTKEALTAQSARIDAVSGATYTSSGYIQSLQSALDKARS